MFLSVTTALYLPLGDGRLRVDPPEVPEVPWARSYTPCLALVVHAEQGRFDPLNATDPGSPTYSGGPSVVSIPDPRKISVGRRVVWYRSTRKFRTDRLVGSLSTRPTNSCSGLCHIGSVAFHRASISHPGGRMVLLDPASDTVSVSNEGRRSANEDRHPFLSPKWKTALYRLPQWTLNLILPHFIGLGRGP